MTQMTTFCSKSSLKRAGIEIQLGEVLNMPVFIPGVLSLLRQESVLEFDTADNVPSKMSSSASAYREPLRAGHGVGWGSAGSAKRLPAAQPDVPSPSPAPYQVLYVLRVPGTSTVENCTRARYSRVLYTY